jgi:hypothetical protein
VAASNDKPEHRRFPRLQRPFDGTWRGASGLANGRIIDLSLGGCFVQSLAAPATGEETEVTIRFASNHAVQFSGRVVYVERGIGFAVEFEPMTSEQSEALTVLFDALRPQGA